MNSDNHEMINLDRQIKSYEDCIARLEESRKEGRGDVQKVCEEIDRAYKQLSLLRIRKMMMIA